MAEIIKYEGGKCAFCQEEIKIIQPIEGIEPPYYTCDCEGWKKKNPPKETSGWEEIREMRKKGWSYQKIGEMMGVTRQRIHQILKYNSFKKEK